MSLSHGGESGCVERDIPGFRGAGFYDRGVFLETGLE